MNALRESPAVSISSRRCKNKTTYHLRWACPITRKLKSRKSVTDKRVAIKDAAALEKELEQGTYADLQKAPWNVFVDDHVQKIPGEGHRENVNRDLKEFGRVVNPKYVHEATFGQIELFVAHCREEGSAVATINTKLRSLSGALNMAIARGYAAKNPMQG